MNRLLDIKIFKDESGFYILEAKGMGDILITQEVLEDKEYLSFYIKTAIKCAEKK